MNGPAEWLILVDTQEHSYKKIKIKKRCKQSKKTKPITETPQRDEPDNTFKEVEDNYEFDSNGFFDKFITDGE